MSSIDVSSLTIRDCKWVMKQLGHTLPTGGITVQQIQKELQEILQNDASNVGYNKLNDLVKTAHSKVLDELRLKRQKRHNAILGRTSTTTTTTINNDEPIIRFRLPSKAKQQIDELDEDAELCDEIERNLKLQNKRHKTAVLAFNTPKKISSSSSSPNEDDENPYYDKEKSNVRAYNVTEHTLPDGRKLKVYICFGTCQKDVMKLRQELANYIEENDAKLCKSNIRIFHNVHYTKHSEVLIMVKDINNLHDPIGFLSLEVTSNTCKIESLCALGNIGIGEYLVTVAKNVSHITLQRPVLTLNSLYNTIFFYRKLGFTNISPEEALVHKQEKKTVTKLANEILQKYSTQTTTTTSTSGKYKDKVLQMLKDPLYEKFLNMLYRIDNNIPANVEVYQNGLYTVEYEMSLHLGGFHTSTSV